MLDKLKEYLEAFKQEKVDLENADVEEMVSKMLADYEKQVRANIEADRLKKISEKEIEIRTIEKLIEFEFSKNETADHFQEQENTEMPDFSDDKENLDSIAIENL